ncbi:MAG: hypothetical protein SWO11_07585 [Thermodesulfobacteriota bacterium]|nr:hypothetical protein [Thermodesulfobacteriota bacterium]
MKSFFLIPMIIFLTFSLSYGEEKKADEGFWSKLKSKIESIVPKKESSVTTAVGGVRGAKDESAEALYWKGKEIDEKVGEDELNKFKTALEHAINGNDKDSLKVFNELITQYSNSPLKEDAIQAMEKLKIAQ